VGVVVCVLPGVLLGGCGLVSGGAEEDVVTHVEARAEVETLLVIAQNLVGGVWDKSVDSAAERCSLGWGEGARYVLSRFGQGVPVEQQQAMVDAVVAQWAALGVDATVSTLPDLNGVIGFQVRQPGVIGTEPDGFFVEFTISEQVSLARGQSRCAEGDVREID